jgi:tetratricopeptide (TPR) repeat protein
VNISRLRFIVSLCAAAVIHSGALTAQKVSTLVSTVSDIFLTDTGLLPLPDNAVELERISTIRSTHFRSPLRLALGSDGFLYASSWYNDAVVSFDLDGAFRSRLGGDAPRPGFLRNPSHLAARKDGLIIHETDRGRSPVTYDLRIVSYAGKPVLRMESELIDDLAAAPDERILVAPRIDNRASRLIVAHRPDGSISAFGTPMAIGADMGIFNLRSMAVTGTGEIFVAFRLSPILRRYSPDGILREEIVIHSPVIDAKQSYNREALQRPKEDIASSGVAPFQEIFSEIAVCGGKIYLLSHHPRLEITEINPQGGPSATYWMDCPEIYSTIDLAVAEVGGELRFYISRSDPPKYEIDIFRKSKKTIPPGLGGEMENLSAEIAANPGYYLHWHNRGIVKHQLGDYSGAIDDLTRAIELAPSLALPYHNRGLARVKAKEYSAAVDDFTRAIEIAPTAQAFYDRGIARALLADHEKAIGDFGRAAEIDPAIRTKAMEQIIICRRLMKAGKKNPLV